MDKRMLIVNVCSIVKVKVVREERNHDEETERDERNRFCKICWRTLTSWRWSEIVWPVARTVISLVHFEYHFSCTLSELCRNYLPPDKALGYSFKYFQARSISSFADFRAFSCSTIVIYSVVCGWIESLFEDTLDEALMVNHYVRDRHQSCSWRIDETLPTRWCRQLNFWRRNGFQGVRTYIHQAESV